ncbi:MAG: hypothetical protein V7641_1061 [Blastocatellia bacterium]
MSNDSADENSLLQYIINLIESMREEMATKDDLAQMATKDDLAQVETRLITRLEAETTAIRGDIEQVHLRLDSIERALTARLSQLETEISRLRSVVYLLVKDRPELLRLLGQEPPPS